MKYLFCSFGRVAFLALTLVSCDTKKSVTAITEDNRSETKLSYASGFKVTYQSDSTKLVEVTYPFQGATSGYKYLLVPKEQLIPDHHEDVRIVRIPVSRIVCTSTTHIPLLDYLGETDKLVGFPSTDYISSEKARRLVDSGKVQELGVDK